jgi:hypothetical protein
LDLADFLHLLTEGWKETGQSLAFTEAGDGELSEQKKLGIEPFFEQSQ